MKGVVTGGMEDIDEGVRVGVALGITDGPGVPMVFVLVNNPRAISRDNNDSRTTRDGNAVGYSSSIREAQSNVAVGISDEPELAELDESSSSSSPFPLELPP